MTSPALERFTDALTAAGSTGRGSSWQCPAHDDRAPSLSVGTRDDGDGIVVHCHAGCDVEDVLAAIGLATRDLFDEPAKGVHGPHPLAPAGGTHPARTPRSGGRSGRQTPSSRKKEPKRRFAPSGPGTAVYEYVDADGTFLYGKDRRVDQDGKKYFVCWHLAADGTEWAFLDTDRRVLYRLPDVLAAIDEDETVYVCEGEKDADNLAALGHCSTTWVGGAWQAGTNPKWQPEYTEELTGAQNVVVVADNDPAGKATAAWIAAELAPVVGSVRAVMPPKEGDDLTDHLDAGGTLEGLVDLPTEGDDAQDAPTLTGNEGGLADAAGTAQDDGAELGASWRPIDLRETVEAVLGGRVERPRPTIGIRSDGQGLFYAGRVNGLAGSSGSGKTWTAIAVAAQLLAEGRRVLFIDLEDDRIGIATRLLEVGAPVEAIGYPTFVYLNPDEGLTVPAGEHLRAVLDLEPELVVIDSAGESMAADGVNPNDDAEVSRWFRRVPRAIARTGPAVVILDHVTKAGEDALYASGSQRKRAAITGAQYMQTDGRPFSRESAGYARLTCAKDRSGTYARGEVVALVRFDPRQRSAAGLAGVDVALDAPPKAAADCDRFRPTGLMEKVSQALATTEGPQSFRAINKLVPGREQHVRAAIDLLVEEGNVSVVDGPRNSRLHTLERPYSQREDPRSDLYRPSGDSRDAEAPVTVSVSYRGRRETDTQPSPGDGRETVGDGHTLEAVR